MSTSTVNPYLLIGSQYISGLDAVAGSLGSISTVNDLIDQVYSYVIGVYYTTPTKSDEVELKSAIASAVNAYINGTFKQGLCDYNPGQFYWLMKLLKAIEGVPSKASRSIIEDIEDNVSKSDLTLESQAPILLATVIGSSAYSYWDTQIATPGASLWTSYLQSSDLEYASYFITYITSSIIGAISLANESYDYSFLETTTLPSAKSGFITALAGAIVVAAGVVIFDWTPRIQNSNYTMAMLTRSTSSADLRYADPTNINYGKGGSGLTVCGYCCDTHKGASCACPNDLDPCPNHPCGTSSSGVAMPGQYVS